MSGPDRDSLFTSGDEAIGCDSVFGVPSDNQLEEISSPLGTSPEVVEETRRLCLENGYVPPNAEIQYQSELPELCIAPRPVSDPYAPLKLEPCMPGVA